MYGKAESRYVKPLNTTVVAIFLGLGLIASGLFVTLRFVEMQARMFVAGKDIITGVLKPSVTIENRIFNALGKIREESKLVVLSTELMVDHEVVSKKRFMWDYYNLGTTRVRMVVPGNRIQYYIDTKMLNEETVKWDAKKRELSLILPDPVLDESIVEVQSDPSKYIIDKEIGWARLNSWSGSSLENYMRKELRNTVIRMGKEEYYIEKARENSERVIKELIMKIVLKDNRGSLS